MRTFFVVPIMLLLVFQSVRAQETEVEAPPLTDKSIQQWAAGLKQLQQWAKENSNELAEAYSDDGNAADYQAAWAAMQDRAEAYQSEVDAMMRKNGFSSTDEWTATGERIMAAFAAIVSKDQMGALTQQMEASIAQMKSLGMSDEQIKELQNELEKVTNDQFGDVPKSDMSAVERNMDVVKDAVEYYEPDN